jgi:YD repeat-containing protein
MVALIAKRGLGSSSLTPISPERPARIGQASDFGYANLANGNLVIQAEDTCLAGYGLGLVARRIYNSLDELSGDVPGWRWSYEGSIQFQGPGTAAQPATGAKAVRTAGDGCQTVLDWDAARGLFRGRDEEGPDNELSFDPSAHTWTFTDGTTRHTELYAASPSSLDEFRLVRKSSPAGNSIELGYANGHLATVTDSGTGQELRFVRDNVHGFDRPVRIEVRALKAGNDGLPTTTLDDPALVATYAYDTSGRLTGVARYLNPDTGSAPGGSAFQCSLAYQGTSHRLAELAQGDGATLRFDYDAAGRLSSVSDATASAVLTFRGRNKICSQTHANVVRSKNVGP